MRFLVFLLSLFCSAAFAALPMDGLRSGADFLAAEQAFVLDVQQQPGGGTALTWDIAPGYYLYKQRLRFIGLADELAPELPPGLDHEDEYFGASQIYRAHLQISLPAEARGRIEVQWQGCADAGLCYPPQSQTLDLSGAAEVAQADDLALLESLQQQALWLSMAAFFGLGLLLAFAPCSLPMLPILAGIVVGSRASPARGFALAGSYVLSMALVYALLGVLAAALGANLQSLLQQPWLIGSFAALFVMLALPMFGFLFLATALYLLRPLLGQSTWLALSGAWLILAASSLLQLANQVHGQRALIHAGAALLGLWGVAMLLGVTAGGHDPLRPLGMFGAGATVQTEAPAASFVEVRELGHLQRELEAAQARGQWVLVDYYADWCVSCKVMEREVFGNTEVQARLADAHKLRLDVTAPGAASRELLARYQVLGPPTLLLIGPDGAERRQQRITGEVDAQQFLRTWDTTMERG